jgi:DNA-binding response OmpR family regulator
MSRIAVVDDEKNIREAIRAAVEQEFHEVDEYGDGLAAWEGFQRQRPDLVVLDIMMPKMDGMELCRRLRGLSWGAKIPVIFLSSRDEEIDKVLGLESGGDDYVCKPFSLRELTARIRAGLRRIAHNGAAEGAGIVAHNNSADEGILRRGNLALDENRCAALWNNAPIELTVTEFRMLQNLAAFPGFVKTREQLMAAAFPEDNFPNEKAADSHVKRIRRKFLEADSNFDELESVYGLGYRWKETGGLR